MMNRVEMSEEMMAQVNGGKRQTSPVNPYSPNAPWTSNGAKKRNEDAESAG